MRAAAEIMSGIERYAQHQIALSNRIKDESLAVAKAKKAAATDDDKAKVAELEKQLLWDTRIYDARQQSMTAVCESPVLLEQRVFALARAIQEKDAVMDLPRPTRPGLSPLRREPAARLAQRSGSGNRLGRAGPQGTGRPRSSGRPALAQPSLPAGYQAMLE
ncbi:hypothetical protein ACFSKM_14865 [Ancylobacter dichloromethanicus]